MKKLKGGINLMRILKRRVFAAFCMAASLKRKPQDSREDHEAGGKKRKRDRK